jgi:uncharacterized protein with HEPN domain
MPHDRRWRDAATVLDIHAAATRVRHYVTGKSRGDFLEDELTRDAVILQIIVLGEATKRLSTDFRAAHSEIPWSQIAGMRDHLVHGYDQWDFEEVWKVAAGEIPALIDRLALLMPPSGSG